MRIKRLDLKIETVAIICGVEEQALRTNFMKCKLDSNKIRMCGEMEWTL